MTDRYSDRSYLVNVNDYNYRRNRVHIKPYSFGRLSNNDASLESTISEQRQREIASPDSNVSQNLESPTTSSMSRNGQSSASLSPVRE